MPVPLALTQECVLNSNFVGLAPQPSTLSPKLATIAKEKVAGEAGLSFSGMSVVWRTGQLVQDLQSYKRFF